MFALPALLLFVCARIQDPPTVDQIVQSYESEGLKFHKGPCDGDLGAQAHVAVPEGFYFLDGKSARKLLELNQNLTSGSELGALWHAGTQGDSWWVFFEFSGDGYVKDDDKDLDADELMEGFQEGQEAANAERQKRGWPEMKLVGWHKPPFYDPQTNNLTWSKLIESEGQRTVNWSTRLLGREGVMSVDLVLGPEDLEAALPAFATLLEGYEFKASHRYAEFTAGDKVAEYGLAALVAGGAGALALKTGLFAKLWKFLIIPLLAAGAWLKKLFTGRKTPNEDAAGPSA